MPRLLNGASAVRENGISQEAAVNHAGKIDNQIGPHIHTHSGGVPRISVVMPAYNCAAFVEEATRSVLSQTFTDFELIIVDDGSTDGTCEILKQFAKEDSRIRLVCAEHQGLVAALNLGVSLARADLIARMDSDDVCLPNRFALQLEYLLAHPSAVAVGTNAEMIDPDGDPLGIVTPDFEPQELARKLIAGKSVKIWHPSILLRKDILQNVGGYRAKYQHAEDFDLWLRMSEVGELHNLREVLLLYRQHPGSICAQQRPAQRLAVKAAVIDAKRRRGVPQTEEFIAQSKSQKNSAKVTDARARWVRIAIRHGRPATARKHLRSLWKEKPWAIETWLALTSFALCPWNLWGTTTSSSLEEKQAKSFSSNPLRRAA